MSRSYLWIEVMSFILFSMLALLVSGCYYLWTFSDSTFWPKRPFLLGLFFLSDSSKANSDTEV